MRIRSASGLLLVALLAPAVTWSSPSPAAQTPGAQTPGAQTPAARAAAQEDVEALKRLNGLLDLARSKNPVERQEAAEGLAQDASQKSTAALLKLADDDDVLVQLATIRALSGRDSTSAKKELVSLALGSPFAGVRRLAAAGTAASDPEAARAAFLKKASGKTALRAAPALLWAEAGAPGDAEPRDPKLVGKEIKKLSKMRKSRDADQRVAAAAATVAISARSGPPRAQALREFIQDGIGDYRQSEVACAALDAATMVPDPADLDLWLELISEEDLNSVVERRLERALLATLKALPDEELTKALTEVMGGIRGDAIASGPRLARLASVAGDLGLNGERRLAMLQTLLRTKDADTQAAAAKGLGTLGEEGVQLALQAVSDADVPARVAIQCIEVLRQGDVIVAKADGDEPNEAVRFLIQLAELHKERRVQEAAAVALGVAGVHPAAVEALSELARKGSRIGLRNVATIALGRTRAAEAVAPLAEMLGHEDWMMRASAAAGLAQASRIECVEPLIGVLGDEDPQVVATAQQALLTFSDREGEDVDPETWPEWWAENGKRARFRTKEEAKARRDKYGYSVSDEQIYRGLDVIVVPGRGDHIELVLEQLGIQFRTVRAGKLVEGGLHPGAILLVGCTGELPEDDIEVVRWYVRNGGALFTSCWALTYTVVPTHPAVIRRFPSPGEVVDTVFARPTVLALESPYLRGVFDGGVEPYYSLQGAHLIQVVDPERAEVLLDSPYAAARHGSGDLAAWFRVGHGVILDTANHFEEQGFSLASGLSTPVDRQAFAVNHMGLSLERLREIREEPWWRKSNLAAEEIADRSVFRILTNFVREKRING